MEVLRAKTKGLLQVGELTQSQKENTKLNQEEMDKGASILESYPQRLVLELTNACNLRCIMCGRTGTDFCLTTFDMEHLKSLEHILYKVEEVTLFGWGEPTLHPKFIEILEYLDKFPVRKYFVTNGMRLDKIKNALFEQKVDIMAISVDGATKETNDRIRVNSKLEFIVEQLKDIVRIKKEKNISYPYMNFVITLMKSNIDELPDLVKLAAEIGLNEVKGVYLTVFSENLLDETLYDETERVEKSFNKAIELGKELGVKVKLPYLQGEDENKDAAHKPCYVGWRDFFLGSDGYVRPCQSSSVKFFKYDKEIKFEDIWNSDEYKNFRENVNCEGMGEECKRCYQSSHANWNNRHAFIQVGEEFAPTWEK